MTLILRNQDDPRYKLDYWKPVKVYRNLHQKCWSIMQDQLVKAHATSLRMNWCKFLVNAKLRYLAREKHQKNVHAFVHGYIDQWYPRPLSIEKQVVKDKKITYKYIPIEPNEDYEITYTPFGTHPLQDYFVRKKLWKALLNNEDVEEPIRDLIVPWATRKSKGYDSVLLDSNKIYRFTS